MDGNQPDNGVLLKRAINLPGLSDSPDSALRHRGQRACHYHPRRASCQRSLEQHRSRCFRLPLPGEPPGRNALPTAARWSTARAVDCNRGRPTRPVRSRGAILPRMLRTEASYYTFSGIDEQSVLQRSWRPMQLDRRSHEVRLCRCESLSPTCNTLFQRGSPRKVRPHKVQPAEVRPGPSAIIGA